jgi:hypothetical protein
MPAGPVPPRMAMVRGGVMRRSGGIQSRLDSGSVCEGFCHEGHEGSRRKSQEAKLLQK